MSQALPRQRPVSTSGRLPVVLCVLLLSLLVVCARALDLQIVRPQYYQEKGRARHIGEVPVPTQRGTIFDRNGEVLAVSTQAISIVLDPKQMLAQPARIGPVAEALKLDPVLLEQELRARAHLRHWVPLPLSRLRADDAESRLAAMPKLAKGEVRDVSRESQWRRWFPPAAVSAHLIGFVDGEGRGRHGVEQLLDAHLSGTPGRKRFLRDRQGGIIGDLDYAVPVQPGLDVQLSIDLRLQYLAYRALQEAVHLHAGTEPSAHPTTGSIVVLDIPSGQVLAMANYPSFNPNTSEDRALAIRNLAVADRIEPGSTIKPFTLTAALLSGRYTPETVIPIGGKRAVINRHTVTDVKASDELTVTGVLARSSNIGTSRLMVDLPAEDVHKLFRDFGFGERTGTDFLGEESGRLPPARDWRSTRQVTLSYGYGMEVTLLQLAQAYAVFGDQGRLRPVSLQKGMIHEPRAIIDPALAKTMLSMLEAAVQPPLGTGTLAQVPNYRVAGKTGTSKISEGLRGYASGRYASLFAGIAPVSDPRLVCVVLINDPKGEEYYGGAVAAPVFSSVMAGALRLLNVAPDNLGGSGQTFAQLSAEQLREMAAEGLDEEEVLP